MSTPSSDGGDNWVATWAAPQQLTEPGNLPPEPGLSGNTLRQIVYVSIGGSRLRLHYSNAYGEGPLALSAVHVARSTGGHAVDATSDRPLTFSGAPALTIAKGATATSDPLDFELDAQAKLTVTIAFGSTPRDVTGHPGSRTTSYIVAGNAAAAARLASPVTTEHWYCLTGIDVVAGSTNAAVIAIGDSITDGRGSTTDENDRWPDNLSRRLRANPATAGVAVLNLGIGGNAVLRGGLGPPAVDRFERDVLGPSGARWVILLHGVNDVGAGASAQSLIDAYRQFVAAARARGLRIYGVPLLPFGGSHYDSPEHEATRQTVNAFVRSSGSFDAVIDLDAAVRDPENPSRLLAAYDSGDGLHLNAAGYRRMAGAVDLDLFS